MTKEIFEKALHQTVHADDLRARGAALIETIEREVSSDDESYEKKGTHLLLDINKAITEDAKPIDVINNLLIDLTGWSLETLMKKVHLIPDEEGEEQICSYVTTYTDGTESICPVNVDMKTMQVLEFVGDNPTFDEDNKDKEVEFEQVSCDDIECSFDVIPKDQKEADKDLIHFWYDENF